MARFLGWFLGTDMILGSALVILCGGLALADARTEIEAIAK